MIIILAFNVILLIFTERCDKWKEHHGIISVHHMRILKICLRIAIHIMKRKLFWLYLITFAIICSLYFWQWRSKHPLVNKLENVATERNIDGHSKDFAFPNNDPKQLKTGENNVFNEASIIFFEHSEKTTKP